MAPKTRSGIQFEQPPTQSLERMEQGANEQASGEPTLEQRIGRSKKASPQQLSQRLEDTARTQHRQGQAERKGQRQAEKHLGARVTRGPQEEPGDNAGGEAGERQDEVTGQETEQGILPGPGQGNRSEATSEPAGNDKEEFTAARGGKLGYEYLPGFGAASNVGSEGGDEASRSQLSSSSDEAQSITPTPDPDGSNDLFINTSAANEDRTKELIRTHKVTFHQIRVTLLDLAEPTTNRNLNRLDREWRNLPQNTRLIRRRYRRDGDFVPHSCDDFDLPTKHGTCSNAVRDDVMGYLASWEDKFNGQWTVERMIGKCQHREYPEVTDSPEGLRHHYTHGNYRELRVCDHCREAIWERGTVVTEQTADGLKRKWDDKWREIHPNSGGNNDNSNNDYDDSGSEAPDAHHIYEKDTHSAREKLPAQGAAADTSELTRLCNWYNSHCKNLTDGEMETMLRDEKKRRADWEASVRLPKDAENVYQLKENDPVLFALALIYHADQTIGDDRYVFEENLHQYWYWQWRGEYRDIVESEERKARENLEHLIGEPIDYDEDSPVDGVDRAYFKAQEYEKLISGPGFHNLSRARQQWLHKWQSEYKGTIDAAEHQARIDLEKRARQEAAIDQTDTPTKLQVLNRMIKHVSRILDEAKLETLPSWQHDLYTKLRPALEAEAQKQALEDEEQMQKKIFEDQYETSLRPNERADTEFAYGPLIRALEMALEDPDLDGRKKEWCQRWLQEYQFKRDEGLARALEHATPLGQGHPQHAIQPGSYRHGLPDANEGGNPSYHRDSSNAELQEALRRDAANRVKKAGKELETGNVNPAMRIDHMSETESHRIGYHGYEYNDQEAGYGSEIDGNAAAVGANNQKQKPYKDRRKAPKQGKPAPPPPDGGYLARYEEAALRRYEAKGAFKAQPEENFFSEVTDSADGFDLSGDEDSINNQERLNAVAAGEGVDRNDDSADESAQQEDGGGSFASGGTAAEGTVKPPTIAGLDFNESEKHPDLSPPQGSINSPSPTSKSKSPEEPVLALPTQLRKTKSADQPVQKAAGKKQHTSQAASNTPEAPGPAGGESDAPGDDDDDEGAPSSQSKKHDKNRATPPHKHLSHHNITHSISAEQEKQDTPPLFGPRSKSQPTERKSDDQSTAPPAPKKSKHAEPVSSAHNVAATAGGTTNPNGSPKEGDDDGGQSTALTAKDGDPPLRKPHSPSQDNGPKSNDEGVYDPTDQTRVAQPELAAGEADPRATAHHAQPANPTGKAKPVREVHLKLRPPKRTPPDNYQPTYSLISPPQAGVPPVSDQGPDDNALNNNPRKRRFAAIQDLLHPAPNYHVDFKYHEPPPEGQFTQQQKIQNKKARRDKMRLEHNLPLEAAMRQGDLRPKDFIPVSRGESYKHWIRYAWTDVCPDCHKRQVIAHPQGQEDCACVKHRYTERWLCNHCDELNCRHLMRDAIYRRENSNIHKLVLGVPQHDEKWRRKRGAAANKPRCLCGTARTLREHPVVDRKRIHPLKFVKRCTLCLEFIVPVPDEEPRDVVPEPTKVEPRRAKRLKEKHEGGPKVRNDRDPFDIAHGGQRRPAREASLQMLGPDGWRPVIVNNHGFHNARFETHPTAEDIEAQKEAKKRRKERDKRRKEQGRKESEEKPQAEKRRKPQKKNPYAKLKKLRPRQINKKEEFFDEGTREQTKEAVMESVEENEKQRPECSEEVGAAGDGVQVTLDTLLTQPLPESGSLHGSSDNDAPLEEDVDFLELVRQRAVAGLVERAERAERAQPMDPPFDSTRQ